MAALLFAVHLLSAPEHDAAPSAATASADAPGATTALPRSLADHLPRGEREAQQLRVIEVRALVSQDRLGAAQDRAREYFERWPDGPDKATLEALTGVHAPRGAP